MVHVNINREQFKQSLTQYNVIILKFYANWCGPCKTIAPYVSQKVNELKINPNKKFIFLEINVDDNLSQNLASFLKVNSLPTIMSFVGGQKADISIGSDFKSIDAFFQKTQTQLI